ncbi:BLOC-2 complex member HPS5 [Macrosteles quadrilineatus]|uniref:BLOC-2 complex member HPS5 n=1 Tax=Macrosteles quadrilineatus TaxID=74068 RepID=UPI0023E09BBF|nr:BLOC-2 complex member HPS5 [Macrosteles quadrilineatus]
MASNSSASLKFLLVESDNSYSTVNSPLKSTQRIKYTCFDVSPSFLVFGATSGGLYVFRREPCTFLQLLPNKEGAVSRVSISPDEKLIAFASVRGTVCVLQRAEISTGARCLNRSTEHSGADVTALCWVEHSDQVFAGDSQGRLSVINVSLFMSKNMFHVPAFVFMQVDSAVVSVCCRGDRLLVSSYTRCYVCDTAREQYRQVGTKLRDGQYGACYLPTDPVSIYCARPGSRLWQVDEEGLVQSTHQLKHLLARPPVIVVHHSRGIIAPDDDAEWPEQSFNFAQLSVILDKYLLTFKRDGIYILDPEKVDVVLWSDCYKDILDARSIGDIVYVWTESHQVHALQVTPLDKCLLRLYFYKNYDLCSDLCVRYSTLLLQSPETLTKLGPLLGLRDVLKESITNELQDFLKNVETHAKEREISMRLESGIFLVDNLHARWKLIERSRSIPRNNQRNMKMRSSRSRSLPPNQNKRVRQESPKKIPSRNSSVSTNSLPELSKSSDAEEIGKDLKNINKHDINKEYNKLFQRNNQDFIVPQIPFFPLSSPDIIHDALMEIGTSVSGKLMSGTKSLLDRWHKGSQDCQEPLDVRPDGYKEPEQTKFDPTAAEEEIVEGQNRRKHFHPSAPSLDVSELLEMCKGPETELTIEFLEELLDKVTSLCTTFNEQLVSKKSKYCKGVFPFSLYLSKEHFLVISNWFHKSLKNGVILQWLYNQQGHSSEEEAKEHPSVLQDVFSVESLQLDAALSRVLRLFSEILDPYSILESLESLGLPCVYLSWCVVIDRFQEGTFRYITKYGDSDNVSCADWPLPLLLNAIFLSFRLEQVDASFRMAIARGVTLKTVSYILLKLVLHLEVNGLERIVAEQRCNNLLLSYISKMISKKCEITLNDIGLVSHIESAFTQVNAKSDYGTCHCSFPLPGVPVSCAKFSEIGEKLISYHWEVYRHKIPLNGVKPDLLSHTSRKSDPSLEISPKGNESFKKFFEENSSNGETQEENCKSDTESEYLKHIMKVCSVSSNLLLWTLKNKAPNHGNNISLKLVIQLGLVSEFEKFVDCDNAEWWEDVVTMNAHVKKGKCCACGSQWPENRKAGFQWTFLATHILKQLGSGKTVEMLKKYSAEILPGELDRMFYQACVVTGLVDSRMEGLRPKVLDILQRVSDSRRQRAVMTPQVGAELKTALEKDAQMVSMEPLVSSVNHHWGVAVDMASGDCALCSLSLGAPRLLRDVGLRVFACSHAFHNVCLRVAHSLLYCPVCTR